MSESRRPAGWAGATAETSGSARMPRGEGGHLARAGRGADHDFERRGAAGREVAAQCRVDAIARSRCAGSSLALAGRNLIDANGTPSAISAAALSSAILPGRAITNRDSRYQKPVSARSRVPVGGALEPLGGERVDAWPEQRQQRRQHDERERGGDERDDGAGEAHREEEVAAGRSSARRARRRPSAS